MTADRGMCERNMTVTLCYHCGHPLTEANRDPDIDSDYLGENARGYVKYRTWYVCPRCGGLVGFVWSEGD